MYVIYLVKLPKFPHKIIVLFEIIAYSKDLVEFIKAEIYSTIRLQTICINEYCEIDIL